MQSIVGTLNLKSMTDFVKEKSANVKQAKQIRFENSAPELPSVKEIGGEVSEEKSDSDILELPSVKGIGEVIEDIEELPNATVVLLNSPFSDIGVDTFTKELLEYQKKPIAGRLR